jgi:hypothetical protein
VVLYQAELHPDYGSYVNQADCVLKELAVAAFQLAFLFGNARIFFDLYSALTTVKACARMKQRLFMMKGCK